MKVCLLNTFESIGGAARACSRLHEGLSAAGVDTTLLVREHSFPGEGICALAHGHSGHLRAFWDYLPLKFYPRRQLHNFSRAKIPTRAGAVVGRLAPDVVHLHWVTQGFVPVEKVAGFSVPIVWTLHDSWPFTGGCHLPGACRRYEQSCGCCPVLGSTRDRDLSRRVWSRKRRSYPVDRLTIVAPSRWMAARAQASSLLQGCPVEVIPNGIDVALYAPGDKLSARLTLGLPQKRKIILFGAKSALSDPNKGIDLLWETLARLPVELRDKSTLVLFGDNAPINVPPIGMEVVNCGAVSDEGKVINLYRAADLFVMTSRQENLPNMISEAMACGLPCTAFAVGGIPEQISHRQTGCLAQPFDTEAMAGELCWLLVHGALLSPRARDFAVENYALDLVANRHLELYRRVLAESFPRHV